MKSVLFLGVKLEILMIEWISIRGRIYGDFNEIINRRIWVDGFGDLGFNDGGL